LELNKIPLYLKRFDEAIIGMVERDGMTYEEAIEYFDYNIIGAWLGENMPIYIKTKL
jgi:hypothetical protein